MQGRNQIAKTAGERQGDRKASVSLAVFAVFFKPLWLIALNPCLVLPGLCRLVNKKALVAARAHWVVLLNGQVDCSGPPAFQAVSRTARLYGFTG
jgi:hypothetical protein